MNGFQERLRRSRVNNAERFRRNQQVWYRFDGYDGKVHRGLVQEWRHDMNQLTVVYGDNSYVVHRKLDDIITKLDDGEVVVVDESRAALDDEELEDYEENNDENIDEAVIDDDDDDEYYIKPRSTKRRAKRKATQISNQFYCNQDVYCYFGKLLYHGVVNDWDSVSKKLLVSYDDNTYCEHSGELTEILIAIPRGAVVHECVNDNSEGLDNLSDDDELDYVHDELDYVDDDYDDDDDDIFASYHTTPPKTGEQYQEERQRLINIHQAESQDFSKKREAYFKSEEYLKQGDQSRLAGLRAQHSSFIRAVGTDYPPADGNTLAAVLVEAVRASIEKANSAEGVDAFPCPVLEQRDALKGKQFGHHAIRGQDIRGHYTKQKRRGPFGVGFKAERFECGMGAFDIIEASGFCCPNCFKLVPSFDFLRLNYGGYEYDRIYEIATSRDAIDGSVFRDTAELLGSNTKMAKMVRGILRIGTEAENERVPKDLLSVHKERCTCKTPRNWNKNPTSILVAVKQDKTLYTEFGTETPAATSPSRPPRTVQESIARPDYVLPKPDARMYLGVKKDHNRWHVEVKSRGKKLKVEIFTDLDNAIKFYDDLNRKKGCYNFLNRPTDEDYESLMDNKRIGLHDHSSRPEDLYYKNISKCESSNKYRVQLSKFGQPLYRSKERYDSQKEAAEAADVIIRSQIEDGYARWRQLNFPQLHEFKMPLTHYAPAKGFESYKK